MEAAGPQPGKGPDTAGEDSLAPYVAAIKARWLSEDPGRRHRREEGTLVFADVSGFTALSERLAEHGRVGFELLTDELNALYASLARAAMALGGDIVGFGGDALLLHFEGPGHARRAAAAAHDLQVALEPHRRVETEAGVAELRMRVGVATGPVDLYLVGEDHYEMVVAGPTSSRVVQLEGEAPVDGVLLDATTAQAVGLSASDGAAMLNARPDAEPPPLRDTGVIRVPELALPPPLRPHLGDGRVGEHRQLAIGFLKMTGLDGSGADVAAAALHALIDGAQKACARHGVTFLYSDVDEDAIKVLLLGGAPVATGEDEDRLLLTLLDVLALEHELPVRAGAFRGAAFVVDVGIPERRHYTVMGDPVNVAARLTAAAPDGGLLVGTDLLERARLPFLATVVEPIAAKGKAEPISAAVVSGVAESDGARFRRRVGIVGREQELRVLRGLITRAKDGAGGAVELSGEPGIGKTVLLASAMEAAQARIVIRIEGRAYAASSPYRVLRAPLRWLLGAHRDDDAATESALRAWLAANAPELEPLLPLVGIPFGLNLEPTPQTARLAPEFARGVIESGALRVIGEHLPEHDSLLAVEDAHWLDEASAQLLRGVATLAPDRGWVVLSTRREVDEGLQLDGIEHVWRLSLGPLDDAAARELAESGDTEGLAPPDVEALIERSHGNPLFLRELMAAARGAQALSALPETVEALLAARIDTLPPRERAVLRTAAVLGQRFRWRLLEEVLGSAADAQVARALADGGEHLRFTGPESVAFDHALVRDAAYESLPHRRRRELHGRAGEALLTLTAERAEDSAAELAMHFHSARRWDAAWHWARLAGDRALRAAAPIEAVDLYGRALRAARELDDAGLPEVVAVAERMGDAADQAGRYEEATRTFASLRARLEGEPLLGARLSLKEGSLIELAGAYDDALRWYDDATRRLNAAARSDDAEAEILRARIALWRGGVLLRQGRLEDCLDPLRVAHDEAVRLDHRETIAHSAYLLDWALTDLGRPEQSYRDEALRISEELGDDVRLGSVLNNLGVDAYYEGRWAEALDFYERAGEARERAGDIVRRGEVANNIGEVLSDQGRFEDAQERFEEARRHWSAGPYPMGLGLVESNLGRLATRRGEVEEALELLDGARERLAAIGSEALVLEVDCREVERRLAGRRPAARAALTLALEVRARAEEMDGAQPNLLAMLERLIGRAHALMGDDAAAGEAFTRSLELARRDGVRYEEGLTLLAAGQRDAARAILRDLGVREGGPGS